MNIFVGNLNYRTTEDSLRTVFEAFGEVTSVKVVKSWETGRSRGFAFVEMANDEEARAAIAGANGKECDGRALKVNQAQAKMERRGERPRGRSPSRGR